MKITKAELLWSRICNLRCSGCKMFYIDKNFKHDNFVLQNWKNALQNLKNISCEFIAIYGAEPLERFDGLPDLIELIYSYGMKATVITALYDFEKIEILKKRGLDSLTVSYDGDFSGDKSRDIKSSKAFDFLNKIDIRDKAMVMTLHSGNVDQLESVLKKCKEEKIWFLFDIAHDSRFFGKCDSSLLAPVGNDWIELLIKEKNNGVKIQCSYDYLQHLKTTTKQRIRSWHCIDEQEVGFITIDHDGTIYPCDDFQISYHKKIFEDPINWKDFKLWRYGTVGVCSGCCWNTHFDATKISQGLISQKEYIHE